LDTVVLGHLKGDR